MPLRTSSLCLFLLMLAGAVGGANAQLKVRTETIRPPGATAPPTYQFVPPDKDDSAAKRPDPQGAAGEPKGAGGEFATDMARLPPAVLATRARILAAARTGDLQKLVTLMRTGPVPTAFTHTQRQDPSAYWKEMYPDSDGMEILSILITILEMEPVHVEAGTPQDLYVWPYFARLPIRSLTPEQKVELFQVVTGSDYKGMLQRGRYVFYQVGIGPDGAWRYFVSSDQ